MSDLVPDSSSLPASLEQAHARIQHLEQALRAATDQAAVSARRVEQLVNHLQEGLLLTDETGTIVLVNERFCALWELETPAASWIGRSWQEIAAVSLALALDPATFERQVHYNRQRGRAVFNEPIELLDGRVLERDFVPIQAAVPHVPHVLIRLRDVTEFYRATERLRSVASIPAQDPNPICRLTTDGQLLYTNPAANALFNALAEPDQQHLLAKAQELARAALADNSPGQIDLAIGPGFYTAFVSPFPAEGYVNLYLVNISKRVLAERELSQAKEAAEAAVRARENFLANMSHEIRTPMNGVLGMAAQLVKTRLDGRQQELVRIIRSSGQHLLSVINDVLDMAKITSGKLEFEQTAFNLCDSIAEALQPLVLQAVEKGITVTGVPLRESCPVPWVIGDPYRINQVMINLVANAVKFTEPGGTIAIRSRQLDSTEAQLTVEFVVADSGPGIAPELQERIFEGFTQAYADTTRRYGGTGLGLSISRAIVEQLGGTLTVDSVVGQGSTFRFVLALPRTGAVAETTSATVDTGALRGRRMLLVEDNEINRDVARMLLEEWGVEVDEAENGYVGLELFRQHHYDAVLMDIQMPGMSGLEATAHIRQLPDPQRAHVPILALTANAFRADNVRYLAAGMDACLAKPFEEAELYRHLEELLHKAAWTASYDLTKLRTLAHGREAFVVKIINSFLANVPASLGQLEVAAAANDWTQVAAVVHHIKPGVESLGVQGVAEALLQLQQPLLELEAEAPSRHAAVARLAAQLRRVLRELPRELPTSGA